MTTVNAHDSISDSTSMGRDFICARIPHRPPFLWLDRVLTLDAERITAEKHIPENLELFQGHYPDYPLLPGVLLCEAVFQAGSLLIGEQMHAQGQPVQDTKNGVPVLTRILSAKFKREVRPGDTIVLQAAIKEKLGPAWFMKGSVRVNGKVAVQVDFACAKKEAQED